MTVTVLGAGSWGTALAILVARNGNDVVLHGRDADHLSSIGSLRENLQYLPGFVIPDNVRVVSESELMESDLWIVAVPSSGVREEIGKIKGDSPQIVIASKGLEPGTAKTMAEVVQDGIQHAAISALSGPNLAVEIVRGVPTAAVVASKDLAFADRARNAFMCKSYRVYTSDDVMGVELAGSLKNVLAIGAGISDGLGYGNNTKGALLARGLYEITELGAKMGGRRETFMGIAGVGDLFATASSNLSRNYRVGFAVGEGKSLSETLELIGQVAEGVNTAEAAVVLARRNGVQAPIMEAIDSVLKGRMRALDAVNLLMERMPRSEVS